VATRAKEAPVEVDTDPQLELFEILQAEPPKPSEPVRNELRADADRTALAALEAAFADARAAADARLPLVALASCLGQLDAPLPASSAGGVSLRRARNGRRALPRLCVKPDEAAEMLGVSRDYLDEHIKPELRIIRRGSKTILIPVVELERWVDHSAARWST
jgi:hypothetical protein